MYYLIILLGFSTTIIVCVHKVCFVELRSLVENAKDKSIINEKPIIVFCVNQEGNGDNCTVSRKLRLDVIFYINTTIIIICFI